MESMERAAYEEVFSWIRRQLPGWNPAFVHCDFEQALMQAVATVFANVFILGCWFHFRQCLGRKRRQMGLTWLFGQHEHGRTLYRRVGCLPLCPANEIEILLGNLVHYAQLHGIYNPAVRRFLTYVSNTWIRKYGTEVISLFQRRHRTSNASENGNRQLNQLMRERRPNVWVYLGKLELNHFESLYPQSAHRCTSYPQSARRCTTASISLRFLEQVTCLGDGFILLLAVLF